MPLPQVKHPTFKLTLPSTKQEIVFRPFVVKEEKILLVAQSSGDSADIVRSIKQVINNCIITPDVNVDHFTSFDLEYFFIKLRARSVNNVIKLSYKDREDEQIYDVEVDLDTIEVTDSGINDTVEINANTTLKLRYPRVNVIDQMDSVVTEVDFNFIIMTSCLDSLYENDECYRFDDYSYEEIAQYLDELDVKVFEHIKKFVDNMPHISHTVSYTNKNGKKVDIELTTLTDFFSLG